MQTYQNLYQAGWRTPLTDHPDAQLVLLFGDRYLAADPIINAQLIQHFPNADIIGCSTSGEILDTELHDQSLCLSALTFATTTVDVQMAALSGQSLEATITSLTSALSKPNLRYVLALSDGQLVNGTALVKLLKDALPKGTLITGGLAGDGTRFQQTAVWHNGNAGDNLLLCGFYGPDLVISHGSMGGWDPFGPERLITRSSSNVLYTLDGKPALELYKRYLGDHVNDLPASALLFPLLVKSDKDATAVTRTILAVNEADGSMTFAGDIPEGAKAQLMRAKLDRLIDGAQHAAEVAFGSSCNIQGDGLALLISCVGRRLVLKQRTEEELDAVKEVFNTPWHLTGFYAYGEISPILGTDRCALHNQTMTITTLHELHA